VRKADIESPGGSGTSQPRPTLKKETSDSRQRVWRGAAAPVTRDALRSALMPTINSMSATGLVSLPGMMTGQILSGVPVEAVKYQILVMFLIAGGTGFGAAAAVLGGVYRLTDARHRLRLDRLAALQAT